jgi:hypothetical protein
MAIFGVPVAEHAYQIREAIAKGIYLRACLGRASPLCNTAALDLERLWVCGLASPSRPRLDCKGSEGLADLGASLTG